MPGGQIAPGAAPGWKGSRRGEHDRHLLDPPDLADAQPQLVVGLAAERGIEPAGFVEDAPPDERRRPRDAVIAVLDRVPQGPLVHMGDAGGPPALVGCHAVAVEHVALAVAGQVRDDPAHRARPPRVVGAEPRDELPRGALPAGIDRLDLAQARLTHELHAFAVLLLDGLDRAVRRAAIDDEALDLRVVLRQDARERPAHIVDPVETRHDDRHARRVLMRSRGDGSELVGAFRRRHAVPRRAHNVPFLEHLVRKPPVLVVEHERPLRLDHRQRPRAERRVVELRDARALQVRLELARLPLGGAPAARVLEVVDAHRVGEHLFARAAEMRHVRENRVDMH